MYMSRRKGSGDGTGDGLSFEFWIFTPYCIVQIELGYLRSNRTTFNREKQKYNTPDRTESQLLLVSANTSLPSFLNTNKNA